jgi:hypothetical protein
VFFGLEYNDCMGFLDDLVSVAKGYNSLKQEFTSGIDSVKNEVISIKNDAVSTVADVKQQIKPDAAKPASDDNSSITDQPSQ